MRGDDSVVFTVGFPPYYQVLESIKSINDVRTLFPDGKADRLNWCFLSTSGVHGTYTSLDDYEAWKPDGDETEPPEITVLVISPRICLLRYGTIPIEPEDVPWFRQLVASTLAEVIESQQENLPEPNEGDEE